MQFAHASSVLSRSVAVVCCVLMPLSATPDDDPSQQYHGFTVQEWRQRISQLDFTDPHIEDEVPGLMALVRDPNVPNITRRQAAVTLARIGKPAQRAIPLLMALARESSSTNDQSPQFWALKALSLFGPLARDAAPLAVEIVEDPQASQLTRLMSIEVLCQIGPQSPYVLPALTRIIQTTDAVPNTPAAPPEFERRIAAVEGLELLGEHAAPAVPTLIRALDEPSVRMRRAAVFTLGTIGPAAEPAIPELIDRLIFDDSAEVQDLAARTLASIGTSAEPALRQLLLDVDAGVRRRAAAAAGRLPTLDDATAKGLLDVAKNDASPGIRVTALQSLWSHKIEREWVVEETVGHLADDEREARAHAAQLLEAMGGFVLRERQQLDTLAHDERPHVRRAAERVLRSLEGLKSPAPQ